MATKRQIGYSTFKTGKTPSGANYTTRRTKSISGNTNKSTTVSSRGKSAGKTTVSFAPKQQAVIKSKTSGGKSRNVANKDVKVIPFKGSYSNTGKTKRY